VNIDVSNIINLKRVGKKNQVRKLYGEETVVPRHMVAALNDNVKATVMKNVHKLREVESDYYKKIGIQHDMTQDEREKEIALKRKQRKKKKMTKMEIFCIWSGAIHGKGES
jgi:predicted nucleic acid-binding protein